MMIGGLPRFFIQGSVVGGSVRCAWNKRSHRIMSLHGIYNDLDAVSLYPSAMTRLGKRHGGFLKGTPKVIGEAECKIIREEVIAFSKRKDEDPIDKVKIDGYFVEIKVKKIKKKRAFPVLSLMFKGSRKWINDPKELKGETLIVDRFTLEDAVKYQGLEYEILRGYFYDEGRNPTIGKVMTEMFNQRLKHKKETIQYPNGNPIQQNYKNIMNMSYGTNCMKAHETEDKIMEEDDADAYIWRNFNYVKEVTKMAECDAKIITVWKPIDEHFNNAHIGSEILGMSKRIMREVMYLAEDNEINILYINFIAI